MPVLGRVFYWGLDEFGAWAEQALVTVRTLRRTFTEPGHLSWRAEAAAALAAAGADATGLAAHLSKQLARDRLEKVP